MVDFLERALQLAERGSLDQAVQVLEKALHGATKNIQAVNAEAWHLLSLLRADLGQGGAALAALENAHACAPASEAISQELLARYQTEAAWAKAQHLLQQLLAQHADNQALLAQMAHVLYMQGQRQEALAFCDAALSVGGSWNAQVLSNRSMLYAQLGEVTQAKADAQAALALQPDFMGARLNLAVAQLGMRELEACVENCNQILAQEPSQAAALMNAALAEMEMKQQAQAQKRLKQILQAQPVHLQALEQLIISCYHTLDTAGLARFVDRRLALAHDLTGRWMALMASIPLMPSSRAEALACRKGFMRDVLQLRDWVEKNNIQDSDGLVVQEGISPFYYLYHGINDKALLAAYGALCVQLLAPFQSRVEGWRNPSLTVRAQGQDFSPERPLRLGVVSAHIRSHAIWQDKIKGLYACLPEDVEIYTFAVESQEDADTQYAKAHSAHFERGGWRLESWAEKIAAQNLDAVYYPEIGLSAQVFRLACLRLAPVQITSWGNPLTSGLPTIDHFVSAAVFEDAPEGAQALYTEKLHLLKGFPSYYERYAGGEEAFDASEFGLDFAKKLLLCAGTAFKYQFDFADHYADIAAANEGVQLVFFAYDKEMFGRVKDRLQKTFAARGIAADKLVFMPWLSRAQYQYLMRKSYLLLDSLEFSGINTVLQALEVDLPVVTMRGTMLRGRLGSGVLEAVGMHSWVAQSPAEYVDWVQRLVAQPELRGQYQAQLQAVRGAMFDNRAPADAFYDIVRGLCQNQP